MKDEKVKSSIKLKKKLNAEKTLRVSVECIDDGRPPLNKRQWQ